MEMVSMKLKPTKQSEPCPVDVAPDYKEPSYPYGLKLCFEKEQIANLPNLKAVSVGDTVTVMGEGRVVEVSASERQGGDDSRRVEIQLQMVDVQGDAQKDKAAGFKEATTKA